MRSFIRPSIFAIFAVILLGLSLHFQGDRAPAVYAQSGGTPTPSLTTTYTAIPSPTSTNTPTATLPDDLCPTPMSSRHYTGAEQHSHTRSARS